MLPQILHAQWVPRPLGLMQTADSWAVTSVQAYELLRIDMPDEEAALAAAAPVRLLDAARARGAEVAAAVSRPPTHPAQALWQAGSTAGEQCA